MAKIGPLPFEYAVGKKITVNEEASDQAGAKATNALQASASEDYDGDSLTPAHINEYDGWTGAGDFDWGQSAIAGRYIGEMEGSSIAAKDTASSQIATATSSTVIKNGDYCVEPVDMHLPLQRSMKVL
ncbi:MAG TPA: hypothetical protein PLI05_00240 [Methanotrichaceae archaeon]|nr:hypothetical protein [Methanotrichaceae archaeon]HQF15481.1 hypothetical protein [Methanotrichaceae archaeon]HQI90216.1 hypothetical protein [Methanotrichaceae archaeon]HQJ27815.1 hypothetical protein [Methanotrichaceae archaeon]